MDQAPRKPAALMGEFLRCIEASDFDALSNLLCEDAVFDFPFRASGDPISSGRGVITESLRTGFGRFLKTIRFEILGSYPSEDGRSVVTEYSSEGERQAGGTYRNRYICVLQARDGRIAHFREYYNPLALAPAA
jgi:ketosteroid isomerase-like protein